MANITKYRKPNKKVVALAESTTDYSDLVKTQRSAVQLKYYTAVGFALVFGILSLTFALGISLLFAVAAAPLIGCVYLVSEDIEEYLIVKRADKILASSAWRPIDGAPHPQGRTDTYPRHVIQRKAVDDDVQISMTKFTFSRSAWHNCHNYDDYPYKTFSFEEEDQLEDFVNELRDLALSKEQKEIEAYADKTEAKNFQERHRDRRDLVI